MGKLDLTAKALLLIKADEMKEMAHTHNTLLLTSFRIHERVWPRRWLLLCLWGLSTWGVNGLLRVYEACCLTRVKKWALSLHTLNRENERICSDNGVSDVFLFFHW